jgi:FixJ family two-component response regulator
MTLPTIVVIDSDGPRRNAIARTLYAHARHVEPYETSSELEALWPSADVMMIHDGGDSLRMVIALSARREAWLPIIAYNAAPAPSRVVDALRLGAFDYLAWPFTSDELEGRLRILFERRMALIERRRRISESHRIISCLTARERDVLFSLSDGASNKRIAAGLNVSPRTVEIHRANMMSKLGARHLGEAISVALYSQLEADEYHPLSPVVP